MRGAGVALVIAALPLGGRTLGRRRGALLLAVSAAYVVALVLA